MPAPRAVSCTCLSYDCCALCGMFSCDCSAEAHRLIEKSKELCTYHQSLPKPTFEDYGRSITITTASGGSK